MREQSCGSPDAGADVEDAVVRGDPGEVGEGARCRPAEEMELVEWGEVVERETSGVLAGGPQRVLDPAA